MSSLSRVIINNKPEFIAATPKYYSILYASWHGPPYKSRIASPDEPDFVASLIVNGTTMLESQWNTLLKPYNPSFNSTKNEKKSCERFKKQDFLAFKNDIKSSHITEALSNEYLS